MVVTAGEGDARQGVLVSRHGRVLSQLVAADIAATTAVGVPRPAGGRPGRARAGVGCPHDRRPMSSSCSTSSPTTLRPELVDATLADDGSLSFALAAGRNGGVRSSRGHPGEGAGNPDGPGRSDRT